MAFAIGPIMGALMGGGAAGIGAGAAALGGSGMMAAIQGGSTLLSIVSGMNAADEEAANFGMQAADAEQNIQLENLKGIGRRTSLKNEAFDVLGEQQVAFAAGGQDLTFGSPVNAQNEVFEELDSAVQSDNFTQSTRTDRLKQNAKNYRRAGRAVKKRGKLKAFTKAINFGFDVAARG